MFEDVEKNADSMTAERCHKYCKQTYVNSSERLQEINESKLVSRIVEKRGQNHPSCCCRFDDYWPSLALSESWAPKERLLREEAGPYVPFKCNALILTFRISTRTRDSYRQLCYYMALKRPLSMLELGQFLRSATYLNLVKPKHASITQALNQKHVKFIPSNGTKLWLKAFKKPLLDKYRMLNSFEGFQFEASELRKINYMTGSLRKELKSPLVNRAFDEYVVSYALANLAAASLTAINLNNQYNITDEILSGGYDKYNVFDEQSSIEAFVRDPINCEQLNNMIRKLRLFLDDIRIAMRDLFEKGLFEHTVRNFAPAKVIIKSQRIYEKLAQVNCWRQKLS